MIAFIHNWFERHFRDQENTGHVYIEFGADGNIRTLNNESDKSITVECLDGGVTITIKGESNGPSNVGKKV